MTKYIIVCNVEHAIHKITFQINENIYVNINN